MPATPPGLGAPRGRGDLFTSPSLYLQCLQSLVCSCCFHRDCGLIVKPPQIAKGHLTTIPGTRAWASGKRSMGHTHQTICPQASQPDLSLARPPARHPALTHESSAGQPYSPAPASGWSAPGLGLSGPAARTLWRAVHSCAAACPAAWLGTGGEKMEDPFRTRLREMCSSGPCPVSRDTFALCFYKHILAAAECGGVKMVGVIGLPGIVVQVVNCTRLWGQSCVC